MDSLLKINSKEAKKILNIEFKFVRYPEKRINGNFTLFVLNV